MSANFTFILKEPKSSEPTLIYLVLRCNIYKVDNTGKKKYQQFKFSTGMKWNPKQWNFEKHKGMNGNDSPDPDELNQRLNNIENVAANIYRKLVNDGVEITADNFRNELEKRTDVLPDVHRKAVKPSAITERPKTVLTFFEEYINTLQYVYKRGQPYPINFRTKQRYATTLQHLKNFSATAEDWTSKILILSFIRIL
jgi:hypothetical protein